MTMGFNFGGFGAQSSDPNLAEKIAKLKSGKKSSDDQVTEYLEKELGVDRRELPLTRKAAHHRVVELISEASANRAQFVGNSLGLKHVNLLNLEQQGIPCPACGSVEGFWSSNPVKGKANWECEDCGEVTHQQPVPVNAPEVITEHSHGSADWHDWARVYKAYVHAFETDGTPAYDFTVEPTYGTDEPVSLIPLRQAITHTDPMKYPVGTLLRIQRLVIDEKGTKQNERLYVNVGGIFDDGGVTIVETMKPMTDLTGWSVIEEL